MADMKSDDIWAFVAAGWVFLIVIVVQTAIYLQQRREAKRTTRWMLNRLKSSR